MSTEKNGEPYYQDNKELAMQHHYEQEREMSQENYEREEQKRPFVVLRSMKKNGEDNMRTLNAGNEGSVAPHLEIRVLDEPGSGGAHHEYEVWIKDSAEVPGKMVGIVNFQNGPIAKAGVNGLTNEALLAIVIDRLACFAKGPYPSRETSIALTKCQEALHWMEHRTKERAARGVEGKHAA